MRALLVVNPKATATTPRGRDVLIRALGSDLKLDVAETAHRGHATELATEAAGDGLDLVVVLGGDGTVNEVVNGLLADGVRPDAPTLAVVPGGSTNVFSRALGLPRNPVDATSELLAALRAGRSRRIGLGRADERWFTFSAGLGLDAQAVAAVERKRARGRQSTPWLYVNAAVGSYLAGLTRRRPRMTLTAGEDTVDRLLFGIVTNTSPWTYFGERPVVVTPQASFGTGLDLFGMRRMHLPAATRAVHGMLRGTGPRGAAVVHRHDLAGFRLTASAPLAFQADGDHLGVRTEVSFTAVADAIRVVC